MGQSADNLQEAFAGESQANQKYNAFSKKADKEKLPTIAKLFRAAGAAETVHAQNHAQAMGVVGATMDNLKAAADGEAAEFKQMYPGFIQQAEKEGNEKARQTFDYANRVEQIHFELYSKAIKALEAGGDMPATDIFVCRGCGNTVLGEAPDTCPICGAKKSFFMTIE